MVSRKGVSFQLKRLGGTSKLLFRNKMAAIGFILLVVFIFEALGAPLLTPYQPTQIVAGRLAQPEWTMNFSDGYYLSKNLVVVNDPLFNSPSSVQAWTVTASPSSLSGLQISYAPGIRSRADSQGSLQVVSSGAGPSSVTFTQTFQYPYRGPPKEFAATMSYLLTGATGSQPVHVRIFIQHPHGLLFNLLNENDSQSGTWLPPPTVTLDSNSHYIQDVLHTVTSSLTPPEIVFSSTGTYSYGVELTLYGAQTVNIDDVQLSLQGTAFGLLGTDYQGSDVFTQVVYGSRISLFVGLLSAAIGIGLGLVVGLLAGFLGKIVDEVLMRFTDMMLVIPGLPLLIVLVAVLGAKIYNLIIVIGFLGWMGFARIVRSQVLTIRERPFIEAAKAAGAGPGRIITKHVFPNIVSLTYVNLALTVPGAILAESALAFLGLSDPTVNSWGHMFSNIQISGALSSFPPPWWWVLPPGFSIALISLSFILIGYALDEIFNPRLRRRR